MATLIGSTTKLTKNGNGDSVSTCHPEYINASKRWIKMFDALSDEDSVKQRDDLPVGSNDFVYLPRPGGMRKHDTDGSMYRAYKARARFPEICSPAVAGVVGLAFENDPEGIGDDVITNDGRANLALARDVVRSVASFARSVLVVDAPRGGGDPYIAEYPHNALINWHVEPTNPSMLKMAVLLEHHPKTGRGTYSHDTEPRYRRYLKTDNGNVTTALFKVVDGIDEMVEEEIALPLTEIPIITPGSINTTPAIDPMPLLPVANCAFAFYQKSASYEQSLYLTSQPTPWVRGLNGEREYNGILHQGIGSSSLWDLGENGVAGFLEVGGKGLSELASAMNRELTQAETYAVRLTQKTDHSESGTALQLRAATQHASIYSMLDSVSLAITKAQNIRAQWAGAARPTVFNLSTKFSESYASDQMIRVLSDAVNQMTVPDFVLFEALRSAGLTTLSDEDLRARTLEQTLIDAGEDAA